MSVVALLFAASLGGSPMTVDDDPFKPYVEAGVETPIPGNSGWSYCHTGGTWRLWSRAGRQDGSELVAMTVVLHGLRSPGEVVAVDVLGGLPLTHNTSWVANYTCRAGGCWNSAVANYSFPAATVSAIQSGGVPVPVRIRTSGGPKCDITVSISPDDLGQLHHLAQSPRPSQSGSPGGAGQ